MLHTLREVGEFVGIPQDASEYGHPSYIGLRQAGDLIAPLTPDEQRRSLRGIIDRLDSLPPLTLNAQVLAANGYDPVPVRVHLEPTASLVISTKVVMLFNNDLGWLTSENLGSRSGDIYITELHAAENSEYVFYKIHVRRAGIGPGGYGIMESPALQVWARYRPPDSKPDPPPPVRPTISVTTSGPLDALMVSVHGSGFLKNQKPNTTGIEVRMVDAVFPQDWGPYYLGSDGNGIVDGSVGPVITTTLHPDASGTRRLAVSAADSRTDPNSVPAGGRLWSNTVTLTF